MLKENSPIRAYLIHQMRQYPVIYPSRQHLFNHMFVCVGTGYAWNNGSIVEELNYDENTLYNVGVAFATRQFDHGHLESTPILHKPDEKYSPICNIPHNLDPEWREVLLDFCLYVNRFNLEEYKIHLASHLLRLYPSYTVGYSDGFKRGSDSFKSLQYVTNHVSQYLGASEWSVDHMCRLKTNQKNQVRLHRECTCS